MGCFFTFKLFHSHDESVDGLAAVDHIDLGIGGSLLESLLQGGDGLLVGPFAVEHRDVGALLAAELGFTLF